jgi:hypothetical protein
MSWTVKSTRSGRGIAKESVVARDAGFGCAGMIESPTGVVWGLTATGPADHPPKDHDSLPPASKKKPPTWSVEESTPHE